MNLEQLNQQSCVNLILSGGGAKGISHLALIDYLEQNQIRINRLAGASAGALIAVLYASGHSTATILQFFKTTPLFNYKWLSPSRPGIFNSYKYKEILEKIVPSHFEDLKIPVTLSTTNLLTGEPEYFSSGALIKPLIASCAIPAIFSPLEINGVPYSDAGISDNFPVDAIKRDAFMLGSYCCRPGQKNKEQINSTFKIANYANSLLVYHQSKSKFKTLDLNVIFPTGDFNIFNTNRAEEIYDISRQHLKTYATAKV